MNDKPEHHFFASSVLHWTADANLLRCINIQKRRDTQRGGLQSNGCGVWKVPLPADAEYEIRNYSPIVDGAEFIDWVDYATARDPKGRRAAK